MQSMLNLRPSGKLTHGGEIKDNEDGVKKIKEQGKEMSGAEEAQGQRAPVKGTKEGYAGKLSKIAKEAKEQGPFP